MDKAPDCHRHHRAPRVVCAGISPTIGRTQPTARTHIFFFVPPKPPEVFPKRFAISRLQKCYKVLQNAISRCQKCYKVCTFRKSMATTMGSQRFGVAKTQYVCHFFLTLHPLWAPSDLFFARMQNISCTEGDVTHWLCVLLPGSRWFGVVWGSELTCLSRLSHDDGTFT